ncbi:hypothetical protein NUW58_g9358 [Xylaria curta]|uniref:Uncharacterized protein n=1 Tax=Xylaria curta TaxID=42375 RepID=A0ACC1MXA3_9PEZI|nr:hypothetical protein NUW58_g9358 [Xylaria curta]
MPRGRKRAGTPIQRKSKQARREDGLSSEAGVLDDAPTGLLSDGDQDTPKPRTRTRRTPRKSSANTPVISSQISSGTSGRKRGRPRKVPIHEEPTATTEGGPGGDRVSSEHVDGQNADPSPDPPEGGNGMASLLHPSSPQDRTNGDIISSSPSSHHEFLENDDLVMDEGYEGTEPQSDLRSAESEDGLTHHRQDTIADASDFSMIAVESLPSFQASFQASFRGIIDQPASDQHEMGEETSRIINETLDSLRRSLQTETESSSHAADTENGLKRVEERDEIQDQSALSTDHSGRAFSKSPRRPKHLPLSRKVFVGRGNIDDSFSTIPDSILHAATPGRLPTKPIVSEDEHGQHGGEDGHFEDSFSEIPEAVLEAATPRPTRRVETSIHGSPTRDEELYQTTRPTARRSSPDYGSNRLPTPEETSSSNAGSRKAHEEEPGLEPQEQPGSVHRADVPSSPPIRTRPRALDFGYSNLQHELNLVQGRRSSSPPRLPLGANAVNQPQTLEAPLRSTRPSLSPIVRAGRTLQNVMSDNSSPEGRERNLGSPFKGASGSDYPHQSSVARSPSPSIRKRASINKSHLSVGSPTPLDRSFRSHFGRNLVRAPQSSGGAGGPFSQDNITHSRTESLQDFTSQQPYNSGSAGHGSTAVSSSKVDPANIDGHMSWAAHSNSSQRMSHRQSSFQTANSHGQEIVETLNQIATQVATTDDTEVPSEQDHDFYDKQAQDVDENRTDEFEEGEQVNGDINDDDDVDIWDIEASRASPTKLEPAQNPARTLKSDAPPSRRSKVPSPWRRNNRRLIYKDDIASSSQIEIEESSQSEVEQYPPIRSRQRPLSSQPQQESDNQRRGPGPESTQETSAKKQLHEREVTVSPNPSHDSFGEYAGPADSDDADFPVEDEELIAPEQPHGVSDPVHEDHMDEDHEELVEQDEQEDLDMPAAPEASNDVSEYSMVALQAKQTPKVPEKVAPSKSKLFGKFDILSFFSSPATLPTNKSPGPNPLRPADNASTLQSTLETKKPKEPPIALWSTGLFPSLPQNDARASSGRGTNAFSSGSALQSTDTIADTYEPSTSVSPSPSRSLSQSAAPSTPERQVFPPIKQKQNFTPRPGGSRGSLFAPNQGSSSATQGEAYDDDLRQSSEEQESSALTEGSDYERVPPREKPSQWDRNLSPTKSCFRSPLKPTTPGRIVSFSNSALSPLAQVQTQNTLQNNAKTPNIISQGPSLRPTLEDRHDANSNSHR